MLDKVPPGYSTTPTALVPAHSMVTVSGGSRWEAEGGGGAGHCSLTRLARSEHELYLDLDLQYEDIRSACFRSKYKLEKLKGHNQRY